MCVLACTNFGGKQVTGSTGPQRALKAELKSHNFLSGTLVSPHYLPPSNEFKEMLRQPGQQGLGSFAFSRSPSSTSSPTPALPSSPGSSRQQTRSREMSEVWQAPGSSPEGTMVASLQEEAALTRCHAVGSRQGHPGNGSAVTAAKIAEVQRLHLA